MNPKILLILIFLITPTYFFSQGSETGRLSTGLVFYSPFDGASVPSVTLKRISFKQDSSHNPYFVQANLNYPSDQSIVLSSESCSFISYLDLEDKPEKRNAVFWFRISENKNDTISKSAAFENLKIYLSADKSLILKTCLKDDQLSLMLEKQKDVELKESSTLVQLQKDTWYLLSVYYDAKKEYGLKLFKYVGYSVDEIQTVSEKSDIFFKDNLKKTKSDPHLFIMLNSAKNSTLAVNDLRIYDRILVDKDYGKICSYTIDNYLEIAKYELAYTYKKMADEQFIKEDTAAANKNYSRAAKMFNSNLSNSINYDNLEEANPLYATYYKLLGKDIEYRQSLLSQGYSFWGQDFSTIPLFPVTELENFKQAYENFQNIYNAIQVSVGKMQLLNEEQMKENIAKTTKSYQSSIASVEKMKKDYALDFYEAQDEAITARISKIGFRNKEIENKVKNFNEQLDKNEAQIKRTISSMVTQSITRIPIDPSKDLNANLKAVGIGILTNNAELRNSILGTQNDFVNLTNLSIDYYQKSKKALTALNTVIKEGISADNLVTIGTTLSNVEIIPKNEWTTLEENYQKIRGNYADVKKFEDNAKKMIAAANFVKKPNLNNVSQFMDWMGNSGYFPEGKDYGGLYMQVCENIRRKKYDSFYQIGTQLLEKTVPVDVQNNINTLKAKCDNAQPIESIIEQIEKDKEGNITQALGDIIFSEDLWPQIYDFKIQGFIMTGISNTLSAEDSLELKKKLLMALFSKTPDMGLLFFPPKAREVIKTLLDIQDDNLLISRLGEATILSSPSKNRLLIYIDGLEIFSIEKDSIFVGGEKFIFAYNSIEKQSHKYLSELNLLFSDASLRKDLMKHIQVSEWYSFLGPESIYNTKSIYKKVIDKLQVNGKLDIINSIKTDGQKTFIGANVAKAYMDDSRIPKKKPLLNPEEFYQADASNGVKDDTTREMAANAINMAFPGYGTLANQGLVIAGNILDSYDIVDNLKNLYKEQQSLHLELLDQMEKLKSNSFDRKIANFEKDIADINLELANKQKEEFSKMQFDMIADEQIERRTQLSYQLPIFFYYTEKLRYYCTRLFRASTFWYGPKNKLADIIEKDQSNIRLTLDQSINLYSWIKEPDISSMRQDLDLIEAYWRKQYSLITDGETAKKIKYGSVDILTHSFQIDKNSSPFIVKWYEFNEWKKKIKNGQKIDDFEFDIDMPKYIRDNIRDYEITDIEPKVISVAMAALNNRNGIVNSPGPNLEIFHPGISVNKSGNISVLRKQTSSMTANKIEINTDGTPNICETPQSVQKRWEPQEYKENVFEGYDLDTKWKITVKANPTSVNIENIIVQFFYQYKKSNYIPELQSKTSYQVHIEYSEILKQDFRIDLTLEKAKSMKESLDEAKKNNKIVSGDLKEIINKNNTQDVFSK
ncbi:hypothetical protein [Flavobacterium salmonis]|uniref:Uncharacterized protein n=1 Tax=Flavobacterium salmonis TaxID=2654844 RepID=A0A6V6Z271_9FLAO|nr:hypothetical protein [Flavobacterium salmonis]CAD0005765.1 hypothetical protein FLAT13_02934 [Flavobacterium salmonis]